MARSSLETRFFREQSELHFVNKELSKANKQLTNGALSHNFESPPRVYKMSNNSIWTIPYRLAPIFFFRIGELFRRCDPVNHEPDCHHGGNYQWHPPTFADHDYHHGGQMDWRLFVPSSVPRPARDQVHSLPGPRAYTNEKWRHCAQPRLVHRPRRHGLAGTHRQHVCLGALHLQGPAGLHSLWIPRRQKSGRKSREYLLWRNHSARTAQPHDQTGTIYSKNGFQHHCQNATRLGYYASTFQVHTTLVVSKRAKRACEHTSLCVRPPLWISGRNLPLQFCTWKWEGERA